MIRDVVLGLDLATRAGWGALTLDGKRLDSGAWPLAPRVRRSKADRWVRFQLALTDLLRCYEGRVAVLAIERPFEGAARREAKHAASTPSVAWGLLAIAELAAEIRGIEVVKLPPSRVKLLVAGNGRASKPEVATAVVSRVGDVGVDVERGPYDTTDALAVGLAALELYDLEALRCGEVVEVELGEGAK